MDLGTKRPENSTAAVPQSPEMPSVTYPGFSLNDEKAKHFMKEHTMELNDEFEARVKLRLTGMSSEQYGDRVSFDVLTLDDVSESKSSEKEDTGTDENEYPNPAISKMIRSDK